ncbi:hypothetical protein GALMADRAFT_75384 [Galerina marginata CBS 339.88]|uniref:Novel STAND NTPase 1 domain-containing protein n=1 Tax=Galerina marginata (strain CBS 339.88) TaxID=685588 RepID=A0A067SJL0_GALM3|nr:hypothetical protein GALMADRAFT_75384 [Galerina marginata CBS 339.88]
MKHVVTKVDNLDDKLEEFREVFKRSATVLPSETAVQQEIPLKPEIFHGRDDLVNEISQLLVKEETSRVCILGPGGMGKTSVSLAVVESPLVQEHFPDGNIIWVPCIGATSSALFLETLYVQLHISGDNQVTLGKIISELSTSQDPRLVILDNFESPLNESGGAQKQVEDTLRRLVQLDHIAILVTMRGNHSPCHHAIKWQSKYIEPTDEKSSLRIFQEINPRSKDDPDLSRILTVLGHMPFAVTLMANLAEEGRSTAKELLDAWSESGPDILSENPEQSMNRSIGLSVDSDLVKRNPNAGLLLATLALLPAGTTKDNLRWWAPTLQTSMIPSAIATLSKAGLLVENKQQDSNSPVLFVIPVVQSFMRQHERTADEVQRQILSSCCQYVLDHGCRYDDPAFSHKSKALTAEDTNIQSILLRPTTQHTDSSEKIQEALIAFCWYRCDTVPSLEIVNFTVTVAKASRINLYLASALWCLGRTCYQLGEYRLSYDHLQKAYQLFDNLSLGDLKLQRLGGQCGIDLVRVTCISVSDMNEAVSLALNVETKCASLSDDLIHAQSVMYVGRALHGAKRPEEALSYLERAKTMLQAVGNAPSLATACQIISRLHYDAKRLPEALDALKEAWKQTEKNGSPYFQAIISLEYGMMLFSADEDAEAWKYVEISLTKATHVGNRPKIAQSLEYMGYGYLRRSDYRNAYAAYEAAAQKYLGIGDDWASWLVKNCEDNMSRIKQKQTNPRVVVGFIRPSYDFRESPFYPPGSIPASDLPSTLLGANNSALAKIDAKLSLQLADSRILPEL